MQRLRVRYAKRGRLRFTSHRDVQRAFERALRRADVPVAYSHGFTPHPKVSYAGAAPTGAASEAEYLELSVTRVCDPAELRAALDAALPAGLDVLDVAEAGPHPLAELLLASRWRIELPGADPAGLTGAVETFLTADVVEVERLTKNGVRRLNARDAVLAASVDAGPTTVLSLVLRHQSPAVRTDDVLAALRAVAGFEPPAPARVTRLIQGDWDAGRADVVEPARL